jgi:NADH-quinone oxidoreductase subunit G
MINLTIDGREVSVPKGTTVYQAARQHAIDIPIFCYHDRMPPFGACRVCMVEIEGQGKPQTSCSLAATEGMVVRTQAESAVNARKDIIELLLINHPLDCPICDRGGECPLQDQTLQYGPGESRFFEEKRHFKKALPLYPVLTLDRERCIACARCTRFSDLIAGDHALEFYDRGYKTEIGASKERHAEPKFLSNTISICPVGALTSTVYRFRARPWDNSSTPTTCTLCPMGCSMSLDARDGEIMRTRALENHAVNDVWLCDKGAFGYEFISHPARLKQPYVRRNGSLEPATWEDAIATVAAQLSKAIPTGKLAGFGGSPLTTEESYLFQMLMRKVAGVNNVDYRIGMPLHSLSDEGIAPGMEISFADSEDLSVVILLGIDITEELPVLWLRLKRAILKGAKVVFIGHYAPEVASQLSSVTLHTPGEELATLAAQWELLSTLLTPDVKAAIFVGSQYLASLQRHNVLASLLSWQQQKAQLSINLIEGKGNSMGARFGGMHPELLPEGQRLESPGLNAIQVIETAASSGWDYLHVAGANPAAQLPTSLWQQLRSKLQFLVVQDLFMTKTAEAADVVLPVLSFAEKRGHMINIEGRVQPIRPGMDIPPTLSSDGEIFTLIAAQLGYDLLCDESFLLQLSLQRIDHQRPTTLAPPTTAATAASTSTSALAAAFAPKLFDEGVRMQHNPHLSREIRRPVVRIHPTEAAKRKLKGGELVRLQAAGRSIMGAIAIDSGVAAGTLLLPKGFEQLPVSELALNPLNGLMVDLEINPQ